ncbi:Mimivirus encoded protein, putative [Acanthamoeba castellanii str. Neff]|uniref:Mimivirus encoded protein, putative n=1 Tax=Acanthamoeba castellanii (strain ATCC 30010 / Neff) TaxID=1257118 RepID=L8GR98_ACACF|nr:Mimivirus encoded protein, putative [Acanthamoeba castellanii str. Neff]ELR14641.1 Mimivirus encoded protein, putative [Acanthamoeba castellanii str. Neff]
MEDPANTTTKRKRDEAEKEKEEEQQGGGGSTQCDVDDDKKRRRRVVYSQTFTITFGDQAENHAGMQILGQKASEGFTLEDLQTAKAWFEAQGVTVELHHLNEALPSKDAYVLVARNGLKALMGDADAFHEEQAGLQKDSKAKMYGRVVEKRARHNLCFAASAQTPDYDSGKGTVVAFDQVPLLKKTRDALVDLLGDKASGLVAEGNYYFDPSKCGIGFHGDAERCKVVAVRTGVALPLHYQWFLESKPVGQRVKLLLEHGDVYVMSEKAVGTDWKRRQVYTLRHAAGAKKFLTIK